MNDPVTVSARVYALLLFSYPKRFRCEYGAEMARVFTESCRRTYQASGSFALAALWLATLQDVMVSASAEHVSLFLSITKRDLILVARAPAFAAASGALVGTLFCVAAAHLRLSHDREPARMIQQFDSLAVAIITLAVLWFASVLALHIVRRIASRADVTGVTFVTRLQAFARFAKISLILSLASVLKCMFFDARLTFAGLLPTSHQWLAFPLILLATVASIVVLEPFLTLRPLGPRSPKSAGDRVRV